MTESGKRLARAVELGQRMNELRRLMARVTEQIAGLDLDIRTELVNAKNAVVDEESRPAREAVRA